MLQALVQQWQMVVDGDVRTSASVSVALVVECDQCGACHLGTEQAGKDWWETHRVVHT